MLAALSALLIGFEPLPPSAETTGNQWRALTEWAVANQIDLILP